MRFNVPILILILLTGNSQAAPPVENSLGIQLIHVDGGRFIRGSGGGERSISLAFPLHINAQFYGNAEAPPHPTWITQPFYLADKEVTVGQFKQFIAATGYTPKAKEVIGWVTDKEKDHDPDFERNAAFSWQQPGFPQDDQHPVVGLNRYDVQAFIDWLSKKEGIAYRLPTETEWEFCCRAGSTTWFSFGDVPEKVIHQKANVANVELEKHRAKMVERQWLLDFGKEPADPHVFTAPVGSYPPNAWGFYDMHGNAWEWCQDLWLDTVYKNYKRPQKHQSVTGIALNPINLDQPQTEAKRFSCHPRRQLVQRPRHLPLFCSHLLGCKGCRMLHRLSHRTRCPGRLTR